MTPVQLFEAYGAPGSWGRWFALLLELSLLWLAGERLYGIVSIVHVAVLSVEQRARALAFACAHQPPASKKIPEESASAHAAAQHVDETVRCFDFALELSAIRWTVLREPVMVIYLCTLKLLAIALLLLAVPSVGLLGPLAARLCSLLDPVVLLSAGLCLVWPLSVLLLAAAAANREVVQQRLQLRLGVDAALGAAMVAGREPDDVEYVQLRVKACEALRTSRLCWPGGRELGLSEPAALVGLSAVASSLAVAGWLLPAS